MKKIVIIVMSFIWLPGIQAQLKDFAIEKIYPIEASHSYINFVATYMGYAEVRGSFADFNGVVYYNPDNISQTSVSFEVDVASIDSNNDWRDKDLQSANWFDAEKYPKISFESSSSEGTGEGFKVTGELTIKETTKTITIEMNPVIGVMQDIRGDDQVIFTGSYTLDRTEYGVKGENWSRIKEGIAGVANDVRIEFSILGKRLNEGNLSNFVRNDKRPPGRMYKAYQEGGVDQMKVELGKMKEEMEVNHNAINIVGYLLLRKGEKKQALEVMEYMQQEFPEEADVHNSVGVVLASMGKYKQAREHFEKSVALDEGNISARQVLKLME